MRIFDVHVHIQPWQMHYRGMGDRKKMEKEYPVQSRCYACDEIGQHLFQLKQR